MKSSLINSIGEVVTDYGARVMKVFKKGLLGRSLFDFYGDYSVLDWTLTQRHAKLIVNAIKNHKALAYWDIKNEPNLDFKSRGQTLVTAWLDNMIDFVKSQDPNHPITIGWSNAESSFVLKDKLDFVSFHYYEDIDDLIETYNQLKLKSPISPL